MCFVLRCMVLFRLAGAHNSVGAAAQWLRQDGPITRTTRGGAEALTVIDSLRTARTVYILATTTLFNTQETLKKADVKHWFRCRYAANDTRPATRASVNPAHSPTTTSMVLVECDLPRQCFDGAMTLEAGVPAGHCYGRRRRARVLAQPPHPCPKARARWHSASRPSSGAT